MLLRFLFVDPLLWNSSCRHVSFNLKSNSVVVYSPPQHRKRLEKPVRRFDGTDFDIKAYLRHSAASGSIDIVFLPFTLPIPSSITLPPDLQYLRLPQSSDATSSNTPPDSSSATEDTGSEQQQHLSKSERKKQRRKQRWAEKHKANSGTDEDDDEDSAGSSLADVSLPPIRTPVRVPGLHGILRNDNATPLPPEEQDNLAAKATEEEHEQEGKEEEAEGEEDVAGKNTFERHRQTRKLQHGGRGSESSDDTSGAEQSNSNNCRSRNNDRDDGDNADEREDEGRASSQDDASGTSNRHDQACAAPGNKKRKKKKKKKKGSTPCSDGEGSDGSGQHLLGCADHANDSTQGWQRVKHRGASSPPPPTVTAENGPTENKPANGTTPPQLNEMAGGPAAAADYALPVQPSSPASSITPITPSSPAVRSDHFYTSHRVTVTLYRRNEKADLVRWRVTSTHAAVAGPDWCWGVALPPHNGVCPEAAELRVLSVKLELWLPLAPGTAAVHWGCSGTPMSENDARDFLQGGNVQTGTNEVKTPAVPTANASLAQSSTLPNGGALPVRASLAATTGPTTPPSPPASAGAATADHQPISRCVTFTAAGGVRGLTNLGNTCYMNR